MAKCPLLSGLLALIRMADAVLDQLDSLGLAYEVVPCDPDLADTAAFCEAYGYAADDSANAIVVIGKADPPSYVICLVLSSTRLDVNRVVRKRLGVRRASFASAAQTMELTGMEIGGVTPFGISGDLPVWVDARVTTEPDRSTQLPLQAPSPASRAAPERPSAKLSSPKGTAPWSVSARHARPRPR